MSGVLPPNWTVTMLSEVADWSSGGTPKATEAKYYNGDIPWLVIMDLNNEIVTKSAKKITQLGLENSSAKWVDIGSVMVAMYGSIGKLGIAGIKCTTNQAIAFTTRIWGAIPNKYIFYYLQYNAPELLKIGQGGAQKNISQSILKMFPFLLPPLNEQKRIVAKLDAIMPRIDSAKKRLEKIPAILKRFRQSVLTAAVTGKLTEKWREEHPDVESAEALLDEKLRMRKQYFASYWKDFEIPQRWICALLKNIADLRLGKMLDGSKNKGISMRYLRNINVRWFGFDLESLKEIRITQAEKESLSIKTGDVFVCEGGEPGRSAVWKAKENNMTFQKALHRVRMKISFLPDLLVYNLKVDADTKKLDELFTGSTIKHFTGRSLAVYPVAIPPLEEQKEIVRQVDKLFALANKVEEHYQNARARVDALAQSVLAKAFRGELVSQDPNDEPAEKLLQRIQEEKAKMEAELKNASRSARGKKRNGAKMQHTRPEEKQASEP